MIGDHVTDFIPTFHHLNIRSPFDPYRTRSANRGTSAWKGREIEPRHPAKTGFEGLRQPGQDPFVSLVTEARTRVTSAADLAPLDSFLTERKLKVSQFKLCAIVADSPMKCYLGCKGSKS